MEKDKHFAYDFLRSFFTFLILIVLFVFSLSIDQTKVVVFFHLNTQDPMFISPQNSDGYHPTSLSKMFDTRTKFLHSI